jgi:signal recognition particle receptor subunit beta
MLQPGKEVSSTILTVGLNIEEVKFGSMDIMAYGVGGRSNMRPLFRHYYSTTNGLVYILDISTRDSWYIESQKDELQRLLSEQDLIGMPLLILGNKVDLPSAMSQEELEELVNLKSIRRTRAVEVRRVSVLSHKLDAEPINSAFKWLKTQMNHPSRKPALAAPSS